MAARDGNTLRTRRTRSRILAAGLRLFNELGEGRVTTGMIAAELDMSPGNLYYHFRNKDQIVEELFAAFEGRVDIGIGEPIGAPEAIEDLWAYLHLVLEAMRDYRFLYRNLDDLASRSRRFGERFNRILDREFDAVVALCGGLARAGAMRAGPAQIRALARNVLVVATYWLNYRARRAGRSSAPPASDADDLGQGAFQVMALVAPYLVGGARRHLEHLSRRYID